jgi:hypothetical protein
MTIILEHTTVTANENNIQTMSPCSILQLQRILSRNGMTPKNKRTRNIVDPVSPGLLELTNSENPITKKIRMIEIRQRRKNKKR